MAGCRSPCESAVLTVSLTSLRDVRDPGGAVLLVSEDLDELLELADRIVVMSEGRIVFETPSVGAERHVIGGHMGGGH